MRALVDEHGLSIVAVTHDLGLAWNIADRIAVMYLGRIVELGDAEQVLGDPQHPYTRALLSVVPEIRPAWSSRSWSVRRRTRAASRRAAGSIPGARSSRRARPSGSGSSTGAPASTSSSPRADAANWSPATRVLDAAQFALTNGRRRGPAPDQLDRLSHTSNTIERRSRRRTRRSSIVPTASPRRAPSTSGPGGSRSRAVPAGPRVGRVDGRDAELAPVVIGDHRAVEAVVRAAVAGDRPGSRRPMTSCSIRHVTPSASSSLGPEPGTNRERRVGETVDDGQVERDTEPDVDSRSSAGPGAANSSASRCRRRRAAARAPVAASTSSPRGPIPTSIHAPGSRRSGCRPTSPFGSAGQQPTVGEIEHRLRDQVRRAVGEHVAQLDADVSVRPGRIAREAHAGVADHLGGLIDRPVVA